MFAGSLSCHRHNVRPSWPTASIIHLERPATSSANRTTPVGQSSSQMAFEIPQHLPRRALPQDVSSKILNRIDSAFVKDLDANLANSWVAELDESISATKVRNIDVYPTVGVIEIHLCRSEYTRGLKRTSRTFSDK